MKTMVILFQGIVFSMKNRPIYRGNLALEHANLVQHLCSFVKCVFFCQLPPNARHSAWAGERNRYDLCKWYFSKLLCFVLPKRHIDSLPLFLKSFFFPNTDKSYCNFLLLDYVWVLDKKLMIINETKDVEFFWTWDS